MALVSPPMFGCVVAGRLVQTNLQQVDATRFVFVLDDARNINHMAVFLTGAIAFPPGYGATVHFGWPKDGQMSWQFLGCLTNEKPSAIFKVSSFKPSAASSSSSSSSPLTTVAGSSDQMTDDSESMLDIATPAVAASITEQPVQAQLGIAIETMDVIQSLLAQQAGTNRLVLHGSKQPETTLSDYAIITRRILENFYNYVTSFLGEGNDLPSKIITAWYQHLDRKIRLDPDFWKKAIGGGSSQSS